MVFSADFTQEGKKCEILIKGETIVCIVVCSFDRINKGKVISTRYRLQGKDMTIYDNVKPSEIMFKK